MVKRITEQVDTLFTAKEVAHILRVDDTTVRRWIKSGVLEAITLPQASSRKKYRIRHSELAKILK